MIDFMPTFYTCLHHRISNPYIDALEYTLGADLTNPHRTIIPVMETKKETYIQHDDVIYVVLHRMEYGPELVLTVRKIWPKMKIDMPLTDGE